MLNEVQIKKKFFIILLLLSYAAQGYGVTSLAEGMAVPMVQCLLLFRAGICNLYMVPAIARLLFAKNTMESLTSTNECWQT